MLRRGLWLGVAALACVALAGPARAGDDVVRLGLNSSAPTITLEGKDTDRDADTIDARWGYWRGYSRGYYSGYYSPRYYGGYYGGYSYYPRYYGGYSSYYYPRYYGGYSSYYYPRYYGYSYYPRYSYYGGYSYYPRYYGYSSYYYPISVVDDCNPGTYVLGGATVQQPVQPPLNGSAPRDGTYQYDGGPDKPVPMPKVEPDSTRNVPKATVPEGRPVSLPSKPSKYTYPAYGETFEKPAPAQPKSTFSVVKGH